MVDDVRKFIWKKMAEQAKPGYISQEQYQAMALQQRLAAQREQNR
ncbi:hypothetical protein [Curtobacterium sp. SL109]|nr:hypothetical protein [Curtobacterium sp. SL109]MCY1694669.1 hypothetical protein [Curtobacterium sp. SL109]